LHIAERREERMREGGKEQEKEKETEVGNIGREGG
jgi:hypothetical protein